MSDHPERPLSAVRRELRIERAVLGIVVHGYARDSYGAGDAFADLAAAEPTMLEVFPLLLWALQRLPRGVGEPTELRDRLTTLYSVPDEETGDA
ncbi:hypothetical protein [Tsukamurella paurometabola]|uniref:Uncharacterized protein n=1 Tax=Tsukamurella paurometabola TaxID=2061 RepID=A0A3P8LG04_TSUPA|nr:hypothetical protein [Tsukamurella paurometabola]UEA83008.1 hypothetical protein LK411_22070 [Tsukamurella paurometabola]VDR40092.1 Uncharacterised protein [Tsukamurella paurometabola]